MYLNFQLTSVNLIEEVLRFKAKWEEQYHNLQNPKKVDFKYEGTSYLLSMKEEVVHLCPQDSDPFLVTRTNKIQQLVGDAMKKDE